MLSLVECTRRLRFTRPGSLLPWMGPALRGLLARRFKGRVCVHPPAEQDGRWRCCDYSTERPRRTCPHLATCPYGQTLEPAPPAGATTFGGQEGAARPVVLTLPFPMPPRVRPGDEFDVKVVCVGPSAQAHAGALWDALADAGGDPRGGFDPDRTTFDFVPGAERVTREVIELPAAIAADEPPIRSLRVELTAPLFLRERDERGRRRHVEQPAFADLLRAALRTVGALFGLYDRPLAADFAGLKAAAAGVPLLASDYAPFYQRHWSNRGGAARPLHGVVGSAVYGPVPAGLACWLAWGGRLHVGTDRVAGAGGWRVVEVDEGESR